MQPILKEDLLSYRFISALTVSPFENRAVFTVSVCDTPKNGYKKQLYSVNLEDDSVTKLKNGTGYTSFAFEKEGVLLLGKKSDKPYSSAFEYLDMNTGEKTAAFTLPYPALSVTKISGDLYLVKADIDTYRPENEADIPEDDEDYIKITELPFWDNGIGYISGKRASLFVYDKAKNESTPVTGKLFNTNRAEIAECGKAVYFTGVEYTEKKHNKSGLYRYDIASGKTEEIIPQGEVRIGNIKYVNGRLFVSACYIGKLGNMEKDSWYVLENNQLKKILANDFTIGCNIATDCRYGSSSSLAEYGGKLLYLTTEVKHCLPNLLDEKGELTRPFMFDGAIDGIAAKGEKILFSAMKKGKLQEVYIFDGKKVSQLTRLNGMNLSGKYVGDTEYCPFVNSQGTRIDGWVIKPIDFDENKKYPALLSMHGGPCVAWGEIFVHEMQMLAGQGYFVFLCNPRGADGRGAVFADLRNKYGTVDFDDFMEFTDHVCKSYPQIDDKKLGVLGGSYGGYMTNWIIGNTDRFAAAVSQRSFCNTISDFGNSCIGYSFDAEQFAATPWTGIDRLWDHSPLKYAPNVKTPTLFIHSIEDYNCPLSQGFEMFSGLKYHGVTSEMVLFKGENHELSRSGKPKHRMRRLAEISRWMEKYLK